MRLLKEGESLKSLEFGNFQGLEQPLDKGLLERVATKTESFAIHTMHKLKDDVRASMTECVASFLAASEKLKSVDIGGYCDNSQEALLLVSSLKQSESVTNIEQLKIYNHRYEPNEDLVEEHAQIV